MISATRTAETMTLLVVAKAPIPGEVKTRLAADLTDLADLAAPAAAQVAAELAAAALRDTVAACTSAVGPHRCRLALSGSLADGLRTRDLMRSVAGWHVVPQHGVGLAERLANAHAEVTGPVLQIGMDTPQVTAELLAEAAGALDRHDAVLAPAADVGWWALGLRSVRHAETLRDVRMSTASTYADTRAVLRRRGLTVAASTQLTDVDHLSDAFEVAAQAPETRFARALHRHVLAAHSADSSAIGAAR